MMTRTLRRLSIALENLTRQDISIDRALDLLEASTQDLEEIIAINTMRESVQETGKIRHPIRRKQRWNRTLDCPIPINVPLYRLADMVNYAQ